MGSCIFFKSGDSLITRESLLYFDKKLFSHGSNGLAGCRDECETIYGPTKLLIESLGNGVVKAHAFDMDSFELNVKDLYYAINYNFVSFTDPIKIERILNKGDLVTFAYGVDFFNKRYLTNGSDVRCVGFTKYEYEFEVSGVLSSSNNYWGWRRNPKNHLGVGDVFRMSRGFAHNHGKIK